MNKLIVETKASDGSWYPLPHTFDTQAQAEKYVVDEVPEGDSARIARKD